MGENFLYQQNLMNIIQILSLLIGYENLIENREQSAQNNIQEANDKQSSLILSEIKTNFENQNRMIEEILLQLRYLNRYLEYIIIEGS